MAVFKNTIVDSSGYLQLPKGTSAQRPSSPEIGYIRWNTDNLAVEMYDSNGWVDLQYDTVPNLVTDNLVLHLDANNSNSYPGSGTIWTDLSGNGNNFNIVSTAFHSGTPSYMDFNGDHGMAKNSSDISLSDSTGVTYFVITRVKPINVEWRTLTRSYTADHHVIIQSGGEPLGMYDNDSAGFISSGVNQSTFPDYNTPNWTMLYWRWQSTSPYYQFSWNNTPGTIRGSITDSNARYNRGFGSIGGYHGGTTTPSNGSQPWGDISVFMAYNTYLSDSQLLQNFNHYKSTYGLT